MRLRDFTYKKTSLCLGFLHGNLTKIKLNLTPVIRVYCYFKKSKTRKWHP
jgi:hypothetical protein